MRSQIDTFLVKRSTNLTELIARKLGEPNRSGFWACPFHQESSPSFHVWTGDDGADRYYCFGCGEGGDVFDWLEQSGQVNGFNDALRLLTNGNGRVNTFDPIKARQVADQKSEQARLKRETALARVAKLAPKVERYHNQVGQILNWWAGQGLDEQAVERWQLGYCSSFQVAPGIIDETAVIPFWNNGQLVSVRHRLLHPNGSGKYRPEFKGIPVSLFNLDTLKPEEVSFGLLEPNEALLVEGEKKAMVLDSLGLPSVGLPGLSCWQESWSTEFTGLKKLYITLDDQKPQTIKQAHRIASSINGPEVLIVAMPCKPDDFFTLYKGKVDDFLGFLKQGRKWYD